jgi:hypothetical protein
MLSIQINLNELFLFFYLFRVLFYVPFLYLLCTFLHFYRTFYVPFCTLSDNYHFIIQANKNKKIAGFKKMIFLFRFPLLIFVNKCKKRIAHHDIWRPVRGFVSKTDTYTVVFGKVRSCGHLLFRVFQNMFTFHPEVPAGVIFSSSRHLTVLPGETRSNVILPVTG